MSLKKALSHPGNFPVALDDEEGPEYWQENGAGACKSANFRKKNMHGA
jgi:hypothetical protein